MKRGPDDPGRVLTSEGIASTLDQLLDGVVVLDDEWRVLYMNQAAAGMVERDEGLLLDDEAGPSVGSPIGRHAWRDFVGLAESPFRPLFEDAVRDGEPKQLVGYYEQIARWFEARAVPQGDKLVVVFRDVTDRQLEEGDKRDLFDGIVEAEQILHFGIWRWEVESGRVLWSDGLHHIHGLQPGEFEETIDTFFERIDPADRERVRTTLASALESNRPFAFEARIRHADGRHRTLLSRGRAMPDLGDRKRSLVAVCQDVTERADVEQALGASEQRVQAILENSPSLVIVKDLEDRLVMFNAAAARVAGVPLGDAIGRRTDELLPPELAAVRRDVEQRAISDGQAVSSEFVVPVEGDPRLFVAVTFPLPDPAGAPAEVCTIATDVTERRQRELEGRERANVADWIAAAIEEGRLLVYGQPIFDLARDSIHAFELLVRMRRAGSQPTILGPEAFLPDAERFGLVQKIDTWMVEQAIAVADGHRLQLNLSAVTIADPAAHGQIVDILRRDPDVAKRLTFEITETAEVAQIDAVVEFAQEVTSLGASFSLDDFGVGFSALPFLRSLPFVQIKIDSSFVRRMSSSIEDRRIVTGVRAVAREFHVTTVAEGIEDQLTLDQVQRLGIEFGQGYLFGRPSPFL